MNTEHGPSAEILKDFKTLNIRIVNAYKAES